MRISMPFAFAALLILAGCEGAKDDNEGRDENMTETSNEGSNDAVPLNRSDEPKNVAAPENRMEAPEISDLQQIQDDAEASGMTSRLPEENGTVPATGTGIAADPSGAAGSSGDGPGQR